MTEDDGLTYNKLYLLTLMVIISQKSQTTPTREEASATEPAADEESMQLLSSLNPK